MTELFTPMMVVPYNSFTEYGCIPRSDECLHDLIDVTTLYRLKSCILFISHRWIREEHPDSEDSQKHHIIVEGLRYVINSIPKKIHRLNFIF